MNLILLALALDLAPIPTGPAPTFAEVKRVDPERREILCSQLKERYATVVETIPMRTNGKVVFKTVSRTVPIKEETVGIFSVRMGTVYTPESRRLSVEEVWKRIRVGSRVVVSDDGRIDPYYLRALNPNLLILVGPLKEPGPDSK